MCIVFETTVDLEIENALFECCLEYSHRRTMCADVIVSCVVIACNAYRSDCSSRVILDSPLVRANCGGVLVGA